MTRLPPTPGFWVEEFELPQQPRVEQVVRDGEAYATAVIRKVALYPTGPGTKTLEPLAIEAQVRVQRRSRDRLDEIFGGFFDRSSLFGDVVSTGAASRPIEIEVLPLPAEGRPAGFTGLVGDLAVESSVDRDSLAANEAVTLRVEVSGSGNLKALAPPELAFPPTVEAFPPEVTDRLRTTDAGVSGTRTWEYVLIPRAPGMLTVPGVDLVYFDAAAGRYETASADPVELRVTGRAVVDALPGARARGSVEALRSDIRFIRIDTPRFRRRGETLFDQAWFWVVALAPLGMIAGAAGVRRRRDRLAGDQAYARDRRAARVARKRLARAARLAGGEDARAFHAETAQALEGYAADKLDTSAAGIIRDELRPALAGRGARDATVDQFLEVLDACDRQRFAPVGAEIEERRAFLARAESVLSALGPGESADAAPNDRAPAYRPAPAAALATEGGVRVRVRRPHGRRLRGRARRPAGRSGPFGRGGARRPVSGGQPALSGGGLPGPPSTPGSGWSRRGWTAPTSTTTSATPTSSSASWAARSSSTSGARLELPGDESVRANLELARSLTADQITPLPGFWVPRVVLWAVRLVPRGWLIAIVALGYLALASALLYRLLAREPRPWTRRVAATSAALTLVFGANLLVRESGIGRAERGVILRTETAVQSAPSDDPSLQLFTIHEGAVVRIDRRSDAWLEIVLEDGKVGWVRAGDLETI